MYRLFYLFTFSSVQVLSTSFAIFSFLESNLMGQETSIVQAAFRQVEMDMEDDTYATISRFLLTSVGDEKFKTIGKLEIVAWCLKMSRGHVMSPTIKEEVVVNVVWGDRPESSMLVLMSRLHPNDRIKNLNWREEDEVFPSRETTQLSLTPETLRQFITRTNFGMNECSDYVPLVVHQCIMIENEDVVKLFKNGIDSSEKERHQRIYQRYIRGISSGADK